MTIYLKHRQGSTSFGNSTIHDSLSHISMSTSICSNAVQTGRRVLGRSVAPIATRSQTCSLRSFASTSQTRSCYTFRSVPSSSISPLTHSRRSTIHPASSCTPTSLPNHSRRSFFSLPDISKLAKLASNATSAVPGQGGNEGQVEMDGDKQIYHARKILP